MHSAIADQPSRRSFKLLVGDRLSLVTKLPIMANVSLCRSCNRACKIESNCKTNQATSFNRVRITKQTKWFRFLLIVTFALLATLANAFLVEAGHKGPVKINVWRGPTKGDKKHKFAPWGYHAKLPADVGKSKHYG